MVIPAWKGERRECCRLLKKEFRRRPINKLSIITNFSVQNVRLKHSKCSYSFLVKLFNAFILFFFYFNIVTSYNTKYILQHIWFTCWSPFFQISWKMLANIANNLKWINTWKIFIFLHFDHSTIPWFESYSKNYSRVIPGSAWKKQESLWGRFGDHFGGCTDLIPFLQVNGAMLK